MALPRRLERYALFGALAGRVGATLLARRGVDSGKDDPAARARALDMARTLGRMRGAAMKLGQSIAVAADHFDLAPEVRMALASLHAEGEPVPFASIRRVVEEGLGSPLAELFAGFEEAPLGTASLAQAHAARLYDGRQVVVKVLHEGVEEAVASDLSMMEMVPFLARAFGRPAEELRPLVEELRARLAEELDYAHEAANIDAFVALYGSDPRLRVPRVVRALSSARVLTMDRLPGRPVDLFMAVASREARSRAARTLAEVFFEQTFQHRMLHADPHPGNYLFDVDGRVGLLDYGCVKRFSAASIGGYARIIRGALAGDREEALAGARAFGAWQGVEGAAADAVWEFCESAVAPWKDGEYEVSESTPSMVSRLRAPAEAMSRYREVVAPPDVLMLHRAVAGVYALGRRLGATAAWRGIAERHLDTAIAAALAA